MLKLQIMHWLGLFFIIHLRNDIIISVELHKIFMEKNHEYAATLRKLQEINLLSVSWSYWL